MKKVMMLFLFLLFGLSIAVGRDEFEFHGGLAIPTGDFKNEDQNSSTACGAANGFNFGLKYMHQLPQIQNLFFNVGVDYFHNERCSSWKNNENITYTKSPKYINVPITVGLTFQQPIFKGVKVWEEAGLGVNISKRTDADAEWHYNAKYGYVSGETLDSYKSTATFCYRFGGGVLFANRISLGLYYYSLGSPQYENTHSQPEDGYMYIVSKKTREFKISQLALTLGVRLFKFERKKENNIDKK